MNETKPTKQQVEKFIKERSKCYRYGDGAGMYEFKGREYFRKTELAKAVREYYGFSQTSENSVSVVA